MNLDQDLARALPELVLAIAGALLLTVGAFLGQARARAIHGLAILAMVLAGLALLGVERGQAFGGLFLVDDFAVFMKLLVLIGAALTAVLAMHFLRRESLALFEFPVLMVFATLGMFLMISANDLIALYVGLELQSLALYVIAAFQRDNLRSSEAGVKYFVLGALSSGMLLYGAAMIYGFTGTTAFTDLSGFLAGGAPLSLGLLVGLVFLMAGLAFKISAVPFHMWTPDVYEGAPTAVTAFFAAAPKVAAMALLIRVLTGPFAGLEAAWQQIVIFLSIASMAFGAFAAIAQRNVKRLMAYSSIGHVGYALVGLAAGSEQGVRAVAIYLALYLPMTVGAFACILSMRRDGRLVEGIDDLKGLARTQPLMALALMLFLVSMAGIPPLAGFFSKLYVFQAAVEAGLYGLAVIGVLASVVGVFYYLRIVKLMYFDEPEGRFERPLPREVSVILAASALVTLFFVLAPSPLLEGATAAAASLFPG